MTDPALDMPARRAAAVGASSGRLVARHLLPTVVILSGAALLVSGALPALREWRDVGQGTPLSAFGVPLSASHCDPVTDDASEGAAHVGPGTDRPEVRRVDYRAVPPSSGPHAARPAVPGRVFYTRRDRPPVEQFVHSLEHGYTVVWFDEDLPSPQVEQLRRLVEKLDAQRESAKFVASPWDPSYGALPPRRPVVLAAWGHRQFCGAVSGEAVALFARRFPPSRSPEPSGP